MLWQIQIKTGVVIHMQGPVLVSVEKSCRGARSRQDEEKFLTGGCRTKSPIESHAGPADRRIAGESLIVGPHGQTQGSFAGDRPLAVAGEDVLDSG